MIVCITGATGFIGRKIAELSLFKNAEIRYLTRQNLKPVDIANPIIGDVNSDSAVLVPFVIDCNLFINCAAELNDPAKMLATHVLGTKNLLQLINSLRNDSEVFHWIQLSSCGAYGVGVCGEEKITINENFPANPQNEYERTKTETDDLIIKFAKDNPWFKYTIIRPTNVFGKGMRSTALSRIIKLVKRNLFFYIGTKESIANYVHVDDVVNAIKASISNEHAYNETFIVSNDCRFEDLLNAIASELRVHKPFLVVNKKLLQFFIRLIGLFVDSPIKEHQLDVLTRRVVFSSQKIKNKLGWKPVAPVPDQIKRFINP